MNIGIVTTWFDRGAAIVSKAYMDVLSREHKVFIYARGGERFARNDPRWDMGNVLWGCTRGNKPYMYIDWGEFSSWIKEKHIDLVIFNEQHDWDIILRLRKLHILIGAYVDYYTLETYSFFWLYDFLLCNTKRHYSVFKNHPQSIYIPWGTDINLFKPFPKNDNDCLTFFHSCGVSPNRKGTGILVRAFKKINSNVKLVIHSQIPLAKRFPDLLSLIKSDSRIFLIEKVVPPPGLYHLGDIYVYPTILEGIGLTICEALACGLPVITTNEPPMNEFIIDGQNGRLVDVSQFIRRNDDYYWKQSICSLESLEEKMGFYIDKRNEVNSFKKSARLYAEEKFNWFKNAQFINSRIKDIELIHNNVDNNIIRKVESYEKRRISDSRGCNKYMNRVKNFFDNK